MNIKLKPFDINLAISGAKVVTRDGRKVKFVAYLPNDLTRYPVIAIIEGKDAVDVYSVGGSWHGADLHPEPEDLFLAVDTVTIYVNLYSLPKGIWIGYPTAEEAQNASLEGAIATAILVEIEYKE